jgi:hypothetical protein
MNMCGKSTLIQPIRGSERENITSTSRVEPVILINYYTTDDPMLPGTTILYERGKPHPITEDLMREDHEPPLQVVVIPFDPIPQSRDSGMQRIYSSLLIIEHISQTLSWIIRGAIRWHKSQEKGLSKLTLPILPHHELRQENQHSRKKHRSYLGFTLPALPPQVVEATRKFKERYFSHGRSE